MVAVGGAAALAGCSLITDSFATNDFSGDPFPIQVDLQTGAVMVGLREGALPDRTAVLDVLSPVTLVDPGRDAPQSLRSADLTLLGRSATSGALDVPRARFAAADLFSLHPCTDETCAVGPDGAAQPYAAIVGANALAGDALRLRLGVGEAFILADIGGNDRDRTYVCDAVFSAPYRGGGTLVIADTEVSFGGRRVTLQACLGANPSPLVPQTERGADALLVMSTGIGPSLLSAQAYTRYWQARMKASPPPPPLEMLPEATVVLPSGPVTGRRATLDRLALAGASSSSSRAPCRQVYVHRMLTVDMDCKIPATTDWPCAGSKAFCSVPAVVELAPAAGLDVLVVDDGDPTLQALRAELRPDEPEVDGILGTDAMRTAEIDVDYPHNRVLMRCPHPAPPGQPPGACTTRPAFAEATDCTQIRNCIQAGLR
ncbi:MAG TPA: hypothetical protein VN253_14630 [Kofleriaceae bacterium]|nr:hypothetical protein [Kofleriaceae bacterium]